MGITTIYTCDRCAKQFVKATNLFTVKVIVQKVQREPVDLPHITDGQLWCQTCCQQTHLGSSIKHMDDEHKRKLDIPLEPPKLEDLVREIVRDEIAQQATS